jgi:small-conductance mechanosensitive channel/CRP-like cAMP-binding protein
LSKARKKLSTPPGILPLSPRVKVFVPILAQARADSNFDLSHVIRDTNEWLLYMAAAVTIYLILLFIGRILKRRLGVPLGWFYQMFCFAMAMFVPSLLPQFTVEDSADPHIRAAALLTATFVVISFVRHFIFDSSRRRSDSASLPKFVSQVVSIIIFLAAMAIILQGIYGLEVPGLLAGAGVAGIVLGLALQDTLGNLFSGFAIYFGGQFKAGDWLLIEGHHAQIIEVNWRSTRLRTIDDIYLDIPNSNITKQTVINYDYPSKLHAMLLDIGLEYDAPPAKVKDVLIEAALSCTNVLRDPRPNVYLKEFGDWAITYELRFWIDDHSLQKDVYSEIRTNLWYALRRHDISIPYPIQGEYHQEFRKPAETGEAVREALKKAVFYPCLTPPQFEGILQAAKCVTFGSGENIIAQGDAAGPMYILINGQADVLVESDGASTCVARIGCGDCIGEVSVLTGDPRSATVRAAVDCQAVEVSKATLAPVVAASPEFLEALSDLLARRRLQNEGRLAEASGARSERQKDYSAGFLQKLKSFFEI